MKSLAVIHPTLSTAQLLVSPHPAINTINISSALVDQGSLPPARSSPPGQYRIPRGSRRSSLGQFLYFQISLEVCSFRQTYNGQRVPAIGQPSLLLSAKFDSVLSLLSITMHGRVGCMKECSNRMPRLKVPHHSA